MNLHDARDALHRRARVSARWGYPHDLSSVNVEGRIVGYSESPQVLIETDDGRQVWWAIELTMLEEPPKYAAGDKIDLLNGQVGIVTAVDRDEAGVERLTCEVTPILTPEVAALYERA